MSNHPTAHHHCCMDPVPAQYTVRTNGYLGATALSAFPAMLSQRQDSQIVLTGFLDRSALYGVPDEIETLGLDLVELRRHQVGEGSGLRD